MRHHKFKAHTPSQLEIDSQQARLLHPAKTDIFEISVGANKWTHFQVTDSQILALDQQSHANDMQHRQHDCRIEL